jgi:hypothetical protein
MVALVDVGTRIDVGILEVVSVLAYNRIKVHVDSLELFDTVIELGGK